MYGKTFINTKKYTVIELTKMVPEYILKKWIKSIFRIKKVRGINRPTTNGNPIITKAIAK